MPFFEVAYGHAVRYSQANAESEAAKDAFGIIDPKRMTVVRLPKSPKYMSFKDKKEIQRKLAKRHFRKTGSVLSGWDREPGIANVHWTECIHCHKNIITEPASEGVDGGPCMNCLAQTQATQSEREAYGNPRSEDRTHEGF